MSRPRHSAAHERAEASGAGGRGSSSRRAGLRAAIVACYPRDWRERYGEELIELLERERHSPRVVFDLLRGALDAHLHPQVGQGRPARLRRAAGVALLAAVLVAAGYVGQHPTTTRTFDTLTASRQTQVGVATATLTEHGHSQRIVRPE